MKSFIRKSSTGIFAAIVFAAAILFNILFYAASLRNPMTWDEVDYASAAQSGITANAFERNSLSFIQLAELGLAKINKREPDAAAFPPERSDPFQLRHFHPPLPVYYWNLFLNDNLELRNRSLRISSIFLSVLCACVILFFILKTFRGNGRLTFLAGCTAVPFFTGSTLFLNSFLELNFHFVFLIAVLLFVLSLRNYLSESSRANAIWLGLASTVVVCTLETSAFIFAGAFLSVIILKQQRKFNAHLKIIFLVFIISSLIIWPGIITTLGPVKSWAMYVYRIFAVHNASYEDISVPSKLIKLVSANLIFFLVIIFGYVKLFLVLRADKNTDRLILLPGMIGLFYALAMLPFALNNTYVFPAAGLLFIGSVPGIIKWMDSSVKIKILFSCLCLALIASLYFKTDFAAIKNKSESLRQKFAGDLIEIKDLLKFKQPLLIDGARIFNYYLPGNEENISELFRINTHTAEFAVRENYRYIRQDSAIENKYYKGIIVGKTRNYSPEQYEKLKQWGYQFKELNNYYLFFR